MEDIITFLEKKKPQIDNIIETQIPRNPDKNTLNDICGNPRFTHCIDSAKKAVHEPIWDLLDRGGKRWRPALFLLIVEALGGDVEKLKKFASIPEVVHNGTLMVDDVEDGANLRRGKPSTHKKYGVDVAVNAGNAMYYLPLKTLINQKDLSYKTKARAYDVYCQEMINLAYGQGSDIYWHKGKKENITEEEYLQMCAFKTGTLSRMAAKLAVVFAEGNNEQEEKLGAMAEAIGVAFQIQDDILDITADREDNKFGKTYGNDITEGKRTLMVIHTISKANEKEKERLIEILNKHTTDEKLISEAISIIKSHESIDYAKNKAHEIAKDAWVAAETVLEDSSAKKTLESFIDFLVERKI